MDTDQGLSLGSIQMLSQPAASHVSPKNMPITMPYNAASYASGLGEKVIESQDK